MPSMVLDCQESTATTKDSRGEVDGAKSYAKRHVEVRQCLAVNRKASTPFTAPTLCVCHPSLLTSPLVPSPHQSPFTFSSLLLAQQQREERIAFVAYINPLIFCSLLFPQWSSSQELSLLPRSLPPQAMRSRLPSPVPVIGKSLVWNF